ncbi:hypothetical protein [Sphingomonas kyeonggiensis]|uniref:Uncharacterized protein n=1 Tax=Sphingomonas kyeonggiensis TaxID=1268553 RepID=A0A7W6JXN6_9SPHN|nr:hypothetical protein [Sphingomonas kyeonggiensis]MBB4101474.1 hypothetical protein [Sphingomonas kyeonggiensis]
MLLLESIGTSIGALRSDLGKVLELLDSERDGPAASPPERQPVRSLPQPPASRMTKVKNAPQ